MIIEIPYYDSFRQFERKKVKNYLEKLSKVILTEKANDAFFVEVTAIAQSPIIGILKPRMILGIVTDEKRGEQAFVIKKIEINIHGQVDIYAEHIVMSLCEVSVGVGKLESHTAAEALEQWKRLLIRSNDNYEIFTHFKTSSNLPFGTKLKSSVSPALFENAYQVLMGTRGSILDVWGGEYRFDNTKIELLEKRGVKSNIPMRQGENILDFTYDQMSLDNYDSISGFVKVERDGTPEIYFGKVNPYVVSKTSHDIYQTLSKDFTELVSEKLINDVVKVNDPYVKKALQEAIDKMNQSYVKSNLNRFINEDKESLKVTPHYSSYLNLGIVKEWQVFNQVKIEIPGIGYFGEVKIVETKLDLLTDKLSAISLGKPKRIII